MNENTTDTITSDSAGVYLAQFNRIRNKVSTELQLLGGEYIIAMQNVVTTCIASGMEQNALAKQHCLDIVGCFKSSNATLLNNTISNALLMIDGKQLLITFDLHDSSKSISSAKIMHQLDYIDTIDLHSDMLLLKHLEVLFERPISDRLTIAYDQLINKKSYALKDMNELREKLHSTILSRILTAFELKVGLSFYTLNFSEDMSMKFWDRYTITESTMKSFYIEQHCVIEHSITSKVEPERFITLHKPSKNSINKFLSERYACLTSLSRPIANSEATNSEVEFKQTIETEDDND